jgi:tRNA nucleotidyltransferase (CCA-adding enzyme)
MTTVDTPSAPVNLTLIATHVNADFDALASMLAAQKLYPGAVVVFPGSQERNLRNFFISSMAYLFNMSDLRDIDLRSVSRLVLVDTRQAGRIGPLADVLTREGLEIHVYDHHPESANDVHADVAVCRAAGATVTLLTEILMARQVTLTADEATVMCLGIYEDTGSFTFSSTTPADLQAAAWLLSKGANVNTVATLIAREISPEQIGVLNDMIQSAMRYDINGVEIVLTTVTSESYMPDFAFLVHKMVKMESLDAFIALARMEDKIYVVARSRIAEVDVGEICSPLGGGGHASAASATIRGQTLAQVEQQVLELLHAKVRSSRRAHDLMSAPAISVDANLPCRDAGQLLTRYNINALLVTGTIEGHPRLLGYISRQVVEKALHHHLEAVPVRDYMTTELATVTPDADLAEIQQKIIAHKQRVLPVVEADQIVGVITRTDLLTVLVGQRQHTGPPDPHRERVPARTRPVLKFMQERLSPRLLETLRAIGRTADQAGYSAYVVGGFVRDLFLYRSNEDVDIVIEGDGIAFARLYTQATGGRLHTHEKFGTAVVVRPDGFKIDVASARMEYYTVPAALPTVEMSSIKLDLYRRDFTINTLAIQLNAEHFGTLIDFFGGQRDLKERVIRVLHNLSFVEDPTRVFRAIRFEQRFGLSIGKLTAGLIENAVRMNFFKRLSGRRVFNELRLILEEENPSNAVVRLEDFGLVTAIHPALQMSDEMGAMLDRAQKVLSWHDLQFHDESYMRWAVFFLVLVRSLDRRTTEDICQRLELAPRIMRLVATERFEAERRLRWLERHGQPSDSALYRQLHGLRVELLLYMMAATPTEAVRRLISRFFTRLRHLRSHLGGRDLIALGFVPGPHFKTVLEALRDAHINGDVKSRDDELVLARRLMAEASASVAAAASGANRDAGAATNLQGAIR